MSRHLLILGEDGSSQLVEEARLPTEQELHDALTEHPELIPAVDLGFGRTVVVGKESSLGTGDADLLLLDEHGQLCLVEVKKAGNGDARRVVAQLLDYASQLWGQSLERFWETVVLRYLRKYRPDWQPLPETLEVFLQEAFPPTEKHDEPTDTAVLQSALALTLERGSFVLLVAAPEIPPGVERTLDYLSAQGLRVNALEVGYFHDEVTCFVPRLRRGPAIASSWSTPPALSEHDLLAALDPMHAHVVAQLIDAAAEAGATVEWMSEGASLKLSRSARTKQLALITRSALAIAVETAAGMPASPFETVRTQLQALAAGELDRDGAWWRLRYKRADPAALQAACALVLQLVRALRASEPAG